MTVEIRDALLHLKQYTPDSSESISTDDIGSHARQIAEAAQLRRRGIPTPNPGIAMRLRADDRADELRNLLALSREWPHARAIVASRVSASQG